MKFYKKNDLAQNVFVSGPTRSGKIILSRIISSLKRTENIRVDHLTEQLPIMNRLGQISNEACDTLMRYSVHFMTYDNFIGRNSNFKSTDFTSIWNTPDPEKYLERLNSNKSVYGDGLDGDKAIKKIKKEKIIFNMMIHYELMHVDIYLRSFPKSLFYNLVRHPIDLIFSWKQKGYSDEFITNPRNATLILKHKKKFIPYYAYGIADEFTNSNSIDRLILMTKNSFDISKKNYLTLKSEQKKRVKNIHFDDLVTNPKKYVRKICRELNTQKTNYTNEILKEENCPRKINISERKRKKQFIKKNASNNAVKVLEEMLEEYNNYLKYV